MTIGILGLGEAGALIGADLADAGADVVGWDPVVAQTVGVRSAGGPAGVAEDAAVVLSLNSAADALDAARSVADRLGADQVYADLNTASPGRKRAVAEMIDPSGATFADVALMQSVPGRGVSTPALVSGPGAQRFAAILGPLGMPVDIGGAEVGLAASRKLARSVFVKGMAAAMGEALTAAEALGCADWLHADLERTLDAAGPDTVRHLVEGSRRHAVRRAHEMAAAEEMLAELGVAPRVTTAARTWLEALA